LKSAFVKLRFEPGAVPDGRLYGAPVMKLFAAGKIHGFSVS
jgi:hypothetical protein